MPRRKKIISEPLKEVYPIFQLWIMLCCGIVIFLIGVYLKISNQVAFGSTSPGKFGEVMGNPNVIHPIFCILFGIVFSIFPIYALVKQKTSEK